MAAASRSLANIAEISDRTVLVASITSLLQCLNPQNPNPKDISSERLNQFSNFLDPNLVVQVIREQTNPYHALFFFNWASNLNPKPPYKHYHHTNSCYAAITDVLLSHSLLSTAASLLEKSQKVSDFFISKLIKAYGDRGNVKAAIFWFNQAKRIENGNCLFSYNSLLDVLVGANRIKLAEAFFDQVMKDNAVQPDVSTYTMMIRGYCKLGMIESAKKVFDEMAVKPNLLVYNTMINGFCKKGDMESARLVFDQIMSREDCLPDTVTYTTLVDGYCKKGELEEAMNCFNEMVKRGCHPNVLTYNAMIYGLSLGGRVDEAKRMITKMRLNGLKDNVATHNSILKGLCVVGKFEEAVGYLRNMIKSNMKPDMKSYEVVVRGYCNMGKTDEAISLLKEMQSRGFKPTVSIFNALFRILVKNGELDRAILLLKQMAQMGCLPNFISFSTIICSLCVAKGRMQEVEKLVDGMIRSGHNFDSTMYNCLLKGYCEDGNDEKAMQIAHEMVTKKYVISLESFSVLAKELCAKGKATEGQNLLEMCSKNPAVDVDNYRRVLEHIWN
ncbi:Pentatricopeptide repeat [Melia azedarach]|uniref:Pentatricopeptide repeat n=1 Tax=Melia azedarach TaxID=155640 RepID=A0ACC1XCW7_MELAZ|nr:Pentatricopeptide repeat [Melia azedarach]